MTTTSLRRAVEARSGATAVEAASTTDSDAERAVGRDDGDVTSGDESFRTTIVADFRAGAGPLGGAV